MFNSLNSFTKGNNFAVLDSALVRFSATKQQQLRRQSPLHFSIDKKADNFVGGFSALATVTHRRRMETEA